MSVAASLCLSSYLNFMFARCTRNSHSLPRLIAVAVLPGLGRSRMQPGVGMSRGASGGGGEGRTHLDGVLAALEQQQHHQQEGGDHQGVGDLLSRLSISEEAPVASSGAASSAARAPRPYSLSRQQGTR